MAYIKETIFAGSIMITKLIQKRQKRIESGRAARIMPTSEAVEKANARACEKGLQLKLHANFVPGDYHVVLTYKGTEPTHEEAKACLAKFMRKLRSVAKKSGEDFKWIAVTEYKNHRIHHHVIMNDIVSLQELNAIWTHGQLHLRLLDESGDWRRLGAYLFKETSKTFRDPDAPSRLRYSCSRNLKSPTVYREDVSAAAVIEEPIPEKGYVIDEDTIYRGEDPFTGKPYLEYISIAIEKPKTRKNKTQKRRYSERRYDRWLKANAEKQLTLEVTE